MENKEYAYVKTLIGIQIPAIYNHFKNKLYATMGVSKPMNAYDIKRFSLEKGVDVYSLLKFEARFTEFESYKGVHIFDIEGQWHHMAEECEEQLVLYKSLYDNTGIYARPINMFTSKVDKEKYPDVKQEYRFELVKY